LFFFSAAVCDTHGEPQEDEKTHERRTSYKYLRVDYGTGAIWNNVATTFVKVREFLWRIFVRELIYKSITNQSLMAWYCFSVPCDKNV